MGTSKKSIRSADEVELSQNSTSDNEASGVDAAVVTEENRRKVRRLLKLIRQRLYDLNVHERTVADVLGITPIYWRSLVNGSRSISGLSIEKLRRLAAWLELPLVQVYVAAGMFTAEDFVVRDAVEAQLNRVLAAMQADPRWLALAPDLEEWNELPLKSRVLMAALYEQVKHEHFLQVTEVEQAAQQGA